MNEAEKCSICGNTDEIIVTGLFGMIPVAFCIWCNEGIYSYCEHIKIDTDEEAH
jgi:hypothetical protein